jgi:ABC-type uncharacterized transport system substrate-binding protein
MSVLGMNVSDSIAVVTLNEASRSLRLAHPGDRTEHREIEAAARQVGQSLLVLKASTPGEVEAAFKTLVGSEAGAILVATDSLFLRQRGQIVELAARHAIPAGYFEREFVVGGGFMSYGTSLRLLATADEVIE